MTPNLTPDTPSPEYERMVAAMTPATLRTAIAQRWHDDMLFAHAAAWEADRKEQYDFGYHAGYRDATRVAAGEET